MVTSVTDPVFAITLRVISTFLPNLVLKIPFFPFTWYRIPICLLQRGG
jgi:hypothetical protein